MNEKPRFDTKICKKCEFAEEKRYPNPVHFYCTKLGRHISKKKGKLGFHKPNENKYAECPWWLEHLLLEEERKNNQPK